MPNTLPSPEVVGRRAAEILTAVIDSEDFDRLRESTSDCPECWGTFTGYPLIARWSLKDDSGPLFWEGMRVLALKTAVIKLTDGDEHAAEPEVSAPSRRDGPRDPGAVHARAADDGGVGHPVHSHDRPGAVLLRGRRLHRSVLPGGRVGEPNRRYWIGRPEMLRRLNILGPMYQSIGFQEEGRSHHHDFGGRVDLPEPVRASA